MRMPLPGGAIALVAVLAAGPGCSGAAERAALAGATHAYRCQDGYRFVARFEPERVWLFLGERTLSLPQVPSASDVHYTDGRLTFKARAPRADEAWIEGEGSRHDRCVNQPADVPWEEARLGGADFRAVGHEPLWALEIDDGSGIVFVIDEGKTRHTFPHGSTESREAVVVELSSDGGRAIRVEREPRECIDPASGERFDVSVRVTLDGRDYRGCGRRLN